MRAGKAISLRRTVAVVDLARFGPVVVAAARVRLNATTVSTSQAHSPDHRAVATAMDRINPIYIPRNHQVEEALTAATEGDLTPFERLLEVLARPFDERPGLEAYAQPAPASFGDYITYCGT